MIDPLSLEVPDSRFKSIFPVIAHAAGIIRGYAFKRDNGTLIIESKELNDLVTLADKESEGAIIAGLTSLFPDIPVFGEETGWSNQNHGSSFWILDPLDGTTNFSHGFPQYSISLALVENNQPTLAVVYEVVRDEWFYAASGHGTWLNGKPVRVTEKPTNQSILATGFPYKDFSHLNEFFSVLGTVIQNSNGVRRAGSAASDLAYTAAGRFSGFWEFNLKPWDVAAGILLVKEAGGEVLDYDGSDGMLWSGNIVAGNKETCRWLQSLVRQVYKDKL